MIPYSYLEWEEISLPTEDDWFVVRKVTNYTKPRVLKVSITRFQKGNG